MKLHRDFTLSPLALSQSFYCTLDVTLKVILPTREIRDDAYISVYDHHWHYLMLCPVTQVGALRGSEHSFAFHTIFSEWYLITMTSSLQHRNTVYWLCAVALFGTGPQLLESTPCCVHCDKIFDEVSRVSIQHEHERRLRGQDDGSFES